MKYALTYLTGAATSSCYWLGITVNKQWLVAAIILTIAVVLVAAIRAIEED